MIDATSGNAGATPRPSTALRQQQHQRQLQKKQQADMVTTADFAVFQQQLRQEMTDVIQQLRTEMNETVNGRMDMLNSINTALQNVSTKTTDFKPYRISDLIPRNWEGSNDKGEFRSFTSDLHLWMQAWSDQGERILARVESVDKVDRATLAVDCTEADFRTFETALYQVLHRTTANEPLRVIQQVEGQRGFDAWNLIVRRYDQRNTSDRSSAYAALISNITERDRAKDVEQFDDILRTFTNEMTKFENRFGKIRDEEKVLAVKKLMSESLLNYRFRGTAMPYGELIIALENIMIDKVSTVPTARSRKHDTSAPMEIGMATKEDGENASQEGDQRIVDLALQAVYKGTGKGKWVLARVRAGMRKVAKAAKAEERTRGRKAVARKEAKGRRKVAKEKRGHVGRAARQDTLQLGAGKEATRICTQ